MLLPFCVFSIGMLSILFISKIKKNPANIILDPLICFALACAVYYSFGPLLYIFGPQEGSDYSLSWYPIEARNGLWLTGLNFIGIGVTGCIYRITRFNFVASITESSARRWSKIRPDSVVIYFIVIGTIFKFLFVIPFEFGVTKIPPSAITRAIQNFILVGIFIGYSTPDIKNSAKTVLKYALIMQVVTGILMFNKTETLLAILSAGVGLYIAKQRVQHLIYLSICIIVFYVVLGPIILFGRNQLGNLGTDGLKVAGLLDRAILVQDYFDSQTGNFQSNETPGMWWSRLNYLPPQQAAVDLKNRGRGSDDFQLALWILVPRIIVPDKPILTTAGSNLTDKIHGFSTSSTGIGVFTDGYYNFGWFGVIFASLSYGLALSLYRTIARPIIINRAFVLYPLALIGITVALRPDGWWLTDIAGPIVLTLAALFFVKTMSGRRKLNRR